MKTPTEDKPSKQCPNCGRRFRSYDRLHLHWILYSCTGPREDFLVEQQQKKLSPENAR